MVVINAHWWKSSGQCAGPFNATDIEDVHCALGLLQCICLPGSRL
jgi:hypothetical protein